MKGLPRAGHFFWELPRARSGVKSPGVLARKSGYRRFSERRRRRGSGRILRGGSGGGCRKLCEKLQRSVSNTFFAVAEGADHCRAYG